MSSNRVRRIAKEIAEASEDTFSKIVLNEAGDAEGLSHLEGQFDGPPDTPYEGGKYVVDIKIPTDYPFRPPHIKFKTKIWHPNVSSQTGAICLDTLSHMWSPVLTIKSTLITIQGLLASPEPKDPQDAEVASMMLKDPQEFEHIAREWAVKYANAPERDDSSGSGGMTAEQLMARQREASSSSKENEADTAYHGYNRDLVDRFCQMGFDVESVVAAFEYVGIDKNDGEDYELEEEYMGDITARLFGEPLEGEDDYDYYTDDDFEFRGWM